MQVSVKRKFRVNGKEYNSIEEVPPEYRTAVERALSRRTTTLVRWLVATAIAVTAMALYLLRT